MSLRCFVAMALGREDTDRVYDDLIVPALREKGITPVRVDRIEHNEDIDDRIIRELERCDLALADLTYARPSVYFEAGFAERNVPVIYTCRRDHLNGMADDAYGNFRVHFDLQMRNIIPWSSASDRQFPKRLSKRLGVVTRPLLRDKETHQELKRQVESFRALSIEERMQRMLDISVRRLRGGRYRVTATEAPVLSDLYGVRIPAPALDALLEEIRIKWAHHPRYRLLNAALQLHPGCIARKRASGTIYAVLIHLSVGLTKTALRKLRLGVLDYPVYDINPSHTAGPLKHLVDTLVVCVTRRVPQARILDALGDFSFDRERDKYVRSSTVEVPPEGLFARHAEAYAAGPESGFIIRNARLKDPGRRALHYAIKGGRIMDPDGRQCGQVTTVPRFSSLQVMHVDSEPSLSRQLSHVLDDIGRDCA